MPRRRQCMKIAFLTGFVIIEVVEEGTKEKVKSYI